MVGEYGPRTSIGQPFPKRQILRSSNLKEFAGDNFNINDNDGKSRKHSWKRRNCSLRAISAFPTVFLKDFWERNLFKTLWEKEKMLVTSIFSFSHNVFYIIKDRNYHRHLCYIYFVVCKCFEFGQGQIFVVWEWVIG